MRTVVHLGNAGTAGLWCGAKAKGRAPSDPEANWVWSTELAPYDLRKRVICKRCVKKLRRVMEDPMSEQRHTPGPWSAFEALSGSENHKGWYVGPAGGWKVCMVYPGGSDPTEEAKANGRLIAAAPETAAERDQLKAELAGEKKLHWDAVSARDDTGILWAEAVEERERLREANKLLVEALEHLANEATGFLGVVGNEPWQGARSRLIEAVGLTNIRCLELKTDEAHSALARARELTKGDGA